MANWKMLPGVKGAALFHTEKNETCFRRRSLHRDWSKPGQIISVTNQPNTFVSIGMNPSTADDKWDDPTVHKECAFAMQFAAYIKYTKFNVCDIISSDSKELLNHKNPSSPGNHKFIRDCLRNMNADVLVSWGNLPKGLEYIADDLLKMLRKEGHDLYCFKINKSGTPSHPRFIQLKDLKLQKYF